MQMNTTLNEIRKHSQCKPRWHKLLACLGKTEADDHPLSFREILDHTDLDYAVWCLRVFDYKDYCLFNADLAELVLPIFESKFPDDNRPRFVIESIRKYHSGDIDREALKAIADYAFDAAYEAYADDADDADDAAAYAAAHAADSDADATVATYAYAINAIDAANSDPLKIKELFIKHFC